MESDRDRRDRMTAPARENRAVRHPSVPKSGTPGALVRGPRMTTPARQNRTVRVIG